MTKIKKPGVAPKGLAAGALAAPTGLKEGRPNERAGARAGAAGADPELAEAEVAAPHPGAGVVVEGAAPNEVPVKVGAEAVVVAAALVANPPNVTAAAVAGAAAGAVELVAENDDNENDGAAASTGAGGAAPTAGKPPKVTWVNKAPARSWLRD